MTRTLDRKIKFRLGLALLPVLVVAWYAFQVPREFVDTVGHRRESFEFLERLSNIVLLLQEAETGQRGYLLTGDDAYLRPYLRASREIEGKFRELLEYVPHDLSETEKPGRMGRLIQLKLLELQQTIDLRRNDPEHGLERALEIVNGDQGRHYMQEIQRLAEETRRAETERLDAWLAASDAGARRLLWISAVFSPLTVIVVCFSGWRILHEVHARARAAEEVQRQRLVLETTLASMGEGVIVADGHGRMTLFNPMAERLLGAGVTQQDPSQWSSLYGTFFPDQVTPFPFEELPLVRAIHGESVDDVELFIRRPGTDEGTFLSVTGRPLADSTSESGGGVVVFHDISERRRDAQTLREALERTRDLYDHAPCGYHSLDAAGVVVEMNATELRWLGYERAEVVGKMNFAQLITAASLRVFHEEFAAFKARGEVRDLEFTLVRKDGATFPVLLSSSAVTDVQGRYLHSRSVVVDITDRKRAEEALRRLHGELEERVAQRTEELGRANRELTQKNQEVEMFVYSVSHDLRSPLVNLQGFGQELKTLCGELRSLLAAGETPEPLRTKGIALIDLDVAEAVAFIQSAVLRLSGIIDSLLRLSRAGRIEYQLQPVDMNAVLQRIVHAQTPTIARTRAEVVVGPLPPAFGDPTAVEQIFANLVANSLNYLNPDRSGRIEVSCPAADSGEGRAGVTYCVRDNGLGIPRDFQPKIFQPFQRLHPGQAQGEGIGLMLVRQMVERHGGRIWFESEADAGAAFFVTLPACAVAAFQAMPRPAVSLQESST